MKQCASIYIISEGQNPKVLVQYNPKQKAWLMPGGFVKEYESTLAAAVRETIEEIGKSIANSLVFLGHKTIDNPKLDERSQLLPTVLFDVNQTLSDGRKVQHFIYLARASVTKIDNHTFKPKWITLEELENLDTFENVKIQIRFIFENLNKFEELPYEKNKKGEYKNE